MTSRIQSSQDTNVWDTISLHLLITTSYLKNNVTLRLKHWNRAHWRSTKPSLGPPGSKLGQSEVNSRFA